MISWAKIFTCISLSKVKCNLTDKFDRMIIFVLLNLMHFI